MSNKTKKVKPKQSRKMIDGILKGITYVASLVSVVILTAIIIFVFARGASLLSWDLVTGDYVGEVITMKSPDGTDYKGLSFENPGDLEEGEYFSSRLGVVLMDTTPIDNPNHHIVQVTYLDPASPLANDMVDSGRDVVTGTFKGANFEAILIVLEDDGTVTTASYNDSAAYLTSLLDRTERINTFQIQSAGGGIRGSIIVTLWLVLLTIVIALPIGVFTALYLHELAPKNRFFDVLRSFIDVLNGVPSIIFGLMGAALFIPVTQAIFGSNNIDGGSLVSGALTLAVIVLPVVIKTTEAALDVVPQEYKEASLALGANVTQTTFKVMLPNALPGILSATLLAIGRIIGESAALIFAIGTAIKDEINIFGNGTSLAVHIWTAMSFGETPNVELASSIAIIILIVVLVMNLSVKLITYRFMKRFQ